MAIVEIHIKDDKVQKIEGNGAYVFVHDHDINETTTMIFKHQKEEYDNSKSSRHTVYDTIKQEEGHNKISNRLQDNSDKHV
tara:strand:- start:462 stop:704 length:243 start_codon:yes stop_codon:yes gene_type:complete